MRCDGRVLRRTGDGASPRRFPACRGWPRVGLALLGIALAGLCGHAREAQAQEWRLESGFRPAEARVGETLTFTLVLRAANRLPFHLVQRPDFRDFYELGDDDHTYVHTVNGKTEVVQEIRMRLIPRAAGVAKVSAATVRVGDRDVRSEAVEVVVGVGGSPQQKPSDGIAPRAMAPLSPHRLALAGEDYFLELGVDKDEVVLGEPLRVHYDLLRATARRKSRLDAQMPDFLGVVAFEVEGSLGKSRRVTRAGRAYELDRVATFDLVPTVVGELTVPHLSVEIPGRKGDGEGPEWVASPAYRVQVLPLPDGAPPRFDLANVGAEIRLNGGLQAAGGSGGAVRVGDSLQMWVELSGRGHVGRMQMAPYDAAPAFLVFGPERQRGHSVATEAGLHGEARFHLTLVPKSEGVLAVPALQWPYFDLEKGRYEVLQIGPWEVSVSGVAPYAGDVLATEPASGSHEAVTVAPRELRTHWRADRAVGWKQWWFWGLILGGPLLCAAGPGGRLLRRGHARWLARRQTGLAARRAVASLNACDGQQGADALARALQRYLLDAWALEGNPGGRQGARRLAELGLPPALCERFTQCWAALEAQRYLPGAGAEALPALREQCLELIPALEQARRARGEG